MLRHKKLPEAEAVRDCQIMDGGVAGGGEGYFARAVKDFAPGSAPK